MIFNKNRLFVIDLLSILVPAYCLFKNTRVF